MILNVGGASAFLTLLWTDLRWRASWVGLIAAIGVLPLLAFEFQFDQSVFSTMADALLHGDVLYRDVWEHKPPGVYFTYALAFTLLGRDIWAVRLLETLAVGLSAAGLVGISERRFQSRIGGVVAGLSYSFLYLRMGGNSAQAEAFQVPFVIWALYVWPRAEEQDRVPQRCFVSGVLISIAILFKTPALLLAMAVAVDRLVIDRARRGRDRWIPFGALLAGGLIPGILFVGYYSARGAFEPLMDAMIFFPANYARSGDRPPLGLGLLQAAQWAGANLPVAGLVLGVLGVLILGRRRHPELARWAGITAAALGVVLIQGKNFSYYYYAVLPFAALGMALAFHGDRESAPKAAWISRLSLLLAAGSFVQYGAVAAEPWRTFDRIGRFPVIEPVGVDSSPQPANREIAGMILSLTSPEERIHVWGPSPLLYVFSGRLPAGRYFHLMQVVPPWSKGERVRDLVELLRRLSPKLVVVTSGSQWWAKGKDSRQLLEESSEMKQFLRDEYHRTSQRGAVEFWVRKK